MAAGDITQNVGMINKNHIWQRTQSQEVSTLRMAVASVMRFGWSSSHENMGIYILSHRIHVCHIW